MKNTLFFFSIYLISLACSFDISHAKIIQGREITESEYPFVTGIAKPAGVISCSATKIAKNLIITAAHCREAVLAATLLPSHIFYMPGHLKGSLYKDVALLYYPDAHFENITNIAFNAEVPTEDEKVKFVGFGCDEEAFGFGSGVKRIGENIVDQITNEKDHLPILTIRDYKGSGSCNGDSGGPLFHEDKFIGILSSAPGGNSFLGIKSGSTRFNLINNKESENFVNKVENIIKLKSSEIDEIEDLDLQIEKVNHRRFLIASKIKKALLKISNFIYAEEDENGPKDYPYNVEFDKSALGYKKELLDLVRNARYQLFYDDFLTRNKTTRSPKSFESIEDFLNSDFRDLERKLEENEQKEEIEKLRTKYIDLISENSLVRVVSLTRIKFGIILKLGKSEDKIYSNKLDDKTQGLEVRAEVIDENGEVVFKID